MQFQFDANQDFQLEAVVAVADLFEGQPRNDLTLQFQLEGILAVANQMDLGDAELLRNLQAVQRRSFDPNGEDKGYHGDDALACIQETIQTAKESKKVSFANFSVEMETGTGKTYVYIRTALELHRRYGFRKFIVVVPSVAIREGVLKTLDVTRSHFRQIFDNVPYRFYEYDSASLAQVRQFALSDSVEFMVMTLAAFNKADVNVIHQSTDRLQGETPIHLIQAARPILILDEPQNMESERSIASLAGLNPLFALRYSATHRVPYNVVYRLTPAAAYRQGLVKRIEVASAEREGHVNRPYIKLISTKAEKRTLTAKLSILRLMANGQVKESEVAVSPGASLYLLSNGLTFYQGFDVYEINDGMGFVSFTNTEVVTFERTLGDQQHAIFEAQIAATVEEHVKKQAILGAHGIKVLSLFFIDRVDNYASTDGIIRRLFDQAFERAKSRVPAWQKLTATEVQRGYFAQRKTKSGEVIFEDSKTGVSQKDKEAYDLIMKHKERLLSLDEPVSFIFSHSALREGWDNPNVFQICTLNQSVSDVRKRQEIGRGMRLCVNQQGERLMDERFNVLTVVANESYEDFVKQLQTEISDEYRAIVELHYGKPLDKLTPEERRKVQREYGDILPPPPANARDRKEIHLRKSYMLKPEFKELWERISQKTRYAVQIDSEKLIADVVADLKTVHIDPPRVTITKAKVDLDLVDTFQAWQMSAAKTLVSLVGRYPLPNLLEHMQQLMERTSPPMRITRKTLLEIIKRAPYPQEVVDNPLDWAAVAVDFIKKRLSAQLVDGIQYYKVDEWYEMTLFAEGIESYEQHIVPSAHGLYDGVICDSDVERAFVAGLEQRSDVHFYMKLPDWFKVPTPIGNYNPDWAIVMDDPDEDGDPTPAIFLIAETKGGTDIAKLRFAHEQLKIKYGCRHFRKALGVPYEVLKDTSQLPAQGLGLLLEKGCA